MRLDLVVRAVGRTHPVTVTAAPGATVGDLHRTLAALVAPTAPAPSRERGRLLLNESGVVNGAMVELGDLGLTVIQESEWAVAPWEVAVVGGLHGGRVEGLSPNSAVSVGRGDGCDLVLPDPEVSRAHAVVQADRESVTLRDLGSANGTRFGEWRLDGAAPAGDGQVFGLGESLLSVRRRSAPDAELTSAPGTGIRLVNRPPRITASERTPELVVPVAPVESGGLRLPWAATLLPLLLCGVLYFILPRGFAGYLLMMMLLSPLMAVATLIGDRRSGRRDYRAAKVVFDRAWAEYTATLEEAVAAEERAERLAHPDPGEMVRRSGAGTGRPSALLWQRRPRDPDFLRLRVGLGDRRARLFLLPSPDAPARPGAATDIPPTVRNVPMTVDLREARVFGFAGPRPAALAAVRAVLTQATVLHSPAELGVVIVTGRDTADDWEWATWLPHTLPDSTAFGCMRMIATDAAQAEDRLGELRGLLAERRAEQRGALVQGPPPGRALLLVLDGARRLRDLPGLGELLSEGPAVGVYALCLDLEETALADECGATLVAAGPSGARAELRCDGLSPVRDVLVDGLVADKAIASARALAGLRPLGERGDDTALPDRVRFLELAGLEKCTPEDIRARWKESPDGRSTRALLGMGPDGPVHIDLRRDGPHALIAGTSGAGKSELLQTFVASLATVNTPDALTFVLVDYKGGSAFASCADLPHCVGLVTDLDGRLVNRALDSLSAELRRREALLASAGAKDIEDYWGRTGARLPRLVIVIDEFASLVEELPEFVTGVVGIGMRGRSLGVHIVLATQRPGGVVTADLRANLNLRICLRVTSPAESLDVIEAADAARVPVRAPGRGHLRTGAGELTSFQTARVACPRPTDPADAQGPAVCCTLRRTEALGRPAERSSDETTATSEHTDLGKLVSAIITAAADHGVAEIPSPWLPPLPELLALADISGGLEVEQADIARSGAADGTQPRAVIGVVDRPTAQAQEVFVLELDRTGPVAIAGVARSGRSTALRTLAISLSENRSPEDLHLYAIDCGNHALASLAALPHVGAVVEAYDTVRLERLLAGLQADVTSRQRLLATGGYGSVAEQRAATAPGERLPYTVVLLDGLEAFLARYAELDGGRLTDRLEELLRTGPGAGMTVVFTTDRTGFHHRIASAVAARLVLRQATDDDAAVFGIAPRSMPGRMPPGRGLWAETEEEVQIALLVADRAGGAQHSAVERTAAELDSRWRRIPPERLPRRVDPLPDQITRAEAEELRVTARPTGPAVCTLAAGGDRLGPVDVDLREAGGTFLVSGPQGSGRSTALTAIVTGLDGGLRTLVIAPRPSPLRELAGTPGVIDVLTGDPADITRSIEDAAEDGPLALVVDDAELLTDRTLTDALETFARDVRDTGSVLVAAGTTEDLLSGSYRGWFALVRRARSGLLLNPAAHADGELFGLRLPRSTNGGWPPGRALLIRRGKSVPVQGFMP